MSIAIAEGRARKITKIREGLGGSCPTRMEETAVVAIIEKRVRHAKYGKFMKRTKRLYAHDETNER